MKLGLILAVSEYAHPLTGLPGCTTDAAVFRALLGSQDDVQDVLLIDADTKSASVKNRVAQYVKKYQGKQIDQLILYYTGHGLFQGDEFHYLLSDYDSSRQRQTSLQNAELDGLLRSLSPGVTVKVVDACQSGIQYIKDQGSMAQFLKGTQERFQACYFLFSSRNTESSYQDAQLSDFTRVIAEAVASHQAPTIRYKDIIDYASDAFSQNNVQTPFFVAQADFTDIFCTVTEDLRAKLRAILDKHNKAEAAAVATLQDSATVVTASSMKAHVEAEAKQFCTKDEAIARVASLREELEKAEADGEVAALYEISVTPSETYKGLPSFSQVAEWFKEHEHDFFAETETDSRTRLKLEYRGSVPKWQAALVLPTVDLFGGDDPKYETYYVTTGVKSTVELPYTYLTLHAAARYPNIRSRSLILVPLVSRTKMLIFSCVAVYEQKGWDDEEMVTRVKWQHREVALKDSDKMRGLLHDELLPSFWRSLIDPIVERFRSEPNTDATSGESNKGVQATE